MALESQVQVFFETTARHKWRPKGVRFWVPSSHSTEGGLVVLSVLLLITALFRALGRTGTKTGSIFPGQGHDHRHPRNFGDRAVSRRLNA